MAARTEDPEPGTKFYMLTIISSEVTVIGRRRYFDVRCDCGNIKKVPKASLVHGTTKSCGCAKGLLVADSLRTHGASKSKLYGSWRDMLRRCQDMSDKAYPSYGGRGITVCDRWLVFENFELDMGNPPTADLSIDRVDNSKGYYKENCRWATRTQQANNKRNSVRFDFRGENLTIKEIASKYNINWKTLSSRIYGQRLTMEEAVTRPILTPSEAAALASPRGTAEESSYQGRIEGHKLYGGATPTHNTFTIIDNIEVPPTAETI